MTPELDADISMEELLADGGKLFITMTLRGMPYAEYLQTNHWQSVRQRALRSANYRCQICLSPKRLDVHHISYENLGDESPGDVIALCHGPAGCHEKQHETLRLVARAEGERRFRP